MSQPAPDIAGRTQPPDLPSGRPAHAVAAAQPTTLQPTTSQPPAATQTHVARLIVLIRWIIAYGTDLAASLDQRATHPEFRFFARRYRRGDLATIAARIQRGLLLALGLESRLVALAAKGQDLTIPAWRAASQGAQPSAEATATRAPRRVNIIDLPLDRLPTAEEIADELRHRPVDAVLVDICRDLGLVQNDLPPPLAALLRETIIFYGGNLVTLMSAETRPAMVEALRAALESYRDARARPPAPGPVSPALCTGPP